MVNWLFKKTFQFIESTLNLLPYFVLVTLLGAIFIVIFQSGITFDQLVELLRVLIWPTIVLLSLLFFRKVFTYLFFSIEEFNFFGARGKLKNVRSVVMEKAEDMYESMLQQELQEKEKEENQKELDNIRKSNENQVEKNGKILDLAERILEEKEQLVQENNLLKKKMEAVYNTDSPTTHELQIMINNLLAQIASLQNQINQGANK